MKKLALIAMASFLILSGCSKSSNEIAENNKDLLKTKDKYSYTRIIQFDRKDEDGKIETSYTISETSIDKNSKALSQRFNRDDNSTSLIVGHDGVYKSIVEVLRGADLVKYYREVETNHEVISGEANPFVSIYSVLESIRKEDAETAVTTKEVEIINSDGTEMIKVNETEILAENPVSVKALNDLEPSSNFDYAIGINTDNIGRVTWKLYTGKNGKLIAIEPVLEFPSVSDVVNVKYYISEDYRKIKDIPSESEMDSIKEIIDEF